MWQVAEFRPVGLFSLRPYNATTSGGKSLLVPTPFALKMALLDVLFREQGEGVAQAQWPQVRALEVAIRLPSRVVVNHTFVKILRLKKGKPSDDSGTGLITPLQNTIAFREYVWFGGPLALALRGEGSEPLARLLAQLNYLGKRGGFLQLLAPPHPLPSLADAGSWTVLTEDQASFPAAGTLQPLDDCGPKMTLDHANIYSGKRLALGKENGRLIRPIVLPVRVSQSSRGYTLYEHL